MRTDFKSNTIKPIYVDMKCEFHEPKLTYLPIYNCFLPRKRFVDNCIKSPLDFLIQGF